MSATGGRVLKSRFLLLGTVVASLGSAAPAGQGEAAIRPSLELPASRTAGALTEFATTGDATDGAVAGRSSTRDGSAARDPLFDLAGKSRRAPGRVAPMPASAVTVEENPHVDRVDALRSVFRSTAAAVPWLHLGPPPAARRSGPEIAVLPERLGRFEDGHDALGSSSRAPEHGAGGQGEPLPQLSRELAQFARDLLADPLAWMLGFLALLVAVTVSVIRQRGK